jgi:putative sterol carrier protein
MDKKVVSSGEQWCTRRGRAPGLADLMGDLKLSVQDRPTGVLHVQHGQVSIESGGDATALLAVDSQDTLLHVLGGELHPFVANLQGRLRIEGDRALALRILLGLRAGSPWNGLAKVEAA